MIVLITGASSGIGQALALRFLDRGDVVIALGRREAPLAELAKHAPDQLHYFLADVGDQDDMARVIAEAENTIGAIDTVIAAAGIAEHQAKPGLELPLLQRTFNTNVLGVANTLAPAIEAMRQRGRGQLVILASLASVQPVPSIWIYSSSKVALTYLGEGLYRELKPQGIDVSTICPGFIRTAMTDQHSFPTGWLMELDTAVDKIMNAIDARKRLVCFPGWMYAGLRILNLLPGQLRLAALTRLGRFLEEPDKPAVSPSQAE